MSVRKIYQCNFCSMPMDAKEKDSSGHIGLRPAANQEWFVVTAVNDAVIHLCETCIDLLTRSFFFGDDITIVGLQREIEALQRTTEDLRKQLAGQIRAAEANQKAWHESEIANDRRENRIKFLDQQLHEAIKRTFEESSEVCRLLDKIALIEAKNSVRVPVEQYQAPPLGTPEVRAEIRKSLKAIDSVAKQEFKNAEKCPAPLN